MKGQRIGWFKTEVSTGKSFILIRTAASTLKSIAHVKLMNSHIVQIMEVFGSVTLLVEVIQIILICWEKYLELSDKMILEN